MIEGMKNFILISLVIILLAGCSPADDKIIRLICEFPYTDERIKGINRAFEESWNENERIRNEEPFGNLTHSIVRNQLVKLEQDCIDKGSLAEKYIFTFNERLWGEIGSHQITSSGGPCWLLGEETETEWIEELDTMYVTQNMISFEKKELRINKKMLTGKSIANYAGRDIGSFESRCRIEYD